MTAMARTLMANPVVSLLAFNLTVSTPVAAVRSECPHNCSGRGDCVDGECQCWEGYQGKYCSLGECGHKILSGPNLHIHSQFNRAKVGYLKEDAKRKGDGSLHCHDSRSKHTVRPSI